jgi:hypothetical protein
MARNRPTKSLRKDIVLLRRTSLTAVQGGGSRAISLTFSPIFHQPHLSFRVARMIDDPGYLLFVKVKQDIGKSDVWAALEYLAREGYSFGGTRCVIFSYPGSSKTMIVIHWFPQICAIGIYGVAAQGRHVCPPARDTEYECEETTQNARGFPEGVPQRWMREVRCTSGLVVLIDA